jgi:nucleoid DNA-binding protein
VTLTLVTVTGTLKAPDDLTPLQGTVTFAPNGGVLVDPVTHRILVGSVSVQLDAFGSFSVALPATDNAGNPAGGEHVELALHRQPDQRHDRPVQLRTAGRQRAGRTCRR